MLLVESLDSTIQSDQVIIKAFFQIEEVVLQNPFRFFRTKFLGEKCGPAFSFDYLEKPLHVGGIAARSLKVPL
jgi:competence transcription factor ComK